MPEDGKSIIKRYEELKKNRSNHENRWDRHAPYMAPWSYGVQTKQADGEATQTQVYDSTAIHANDVLSRFICGETISPAEKWLSFKHPDPEIAELDEVKEWSEECTDRVLQAIAKSNFYTEAPTMIGGVTGFGTGCLFRGEKLRDVSQLSANPGYRGLRFKAYKIGRFLIACDGNGDIDTNFIDFTYSAQNCVDRWKELPNSIKEAAKNKPDTKFTIIHACYPRKAGNRTYGNNGMPYVSCYVELESKHKLEESGFEHNPYVDPRWDIIPGEDYGRCPGDIAFNDILTVNAAEQLDAESWALDARPITFARSDSGLGTVDLVPGSFMSVRVPPGGRMQDSFHHYTSGALHQINEIREEKKKNAILQAYNVQNIMEAMAVPKHDETAYSVARRLEILFRTLGPVYGRFQGEFLKPTCDGIFDDMYAAGELSDPPDEVIEYAIQRRQDKVDISMEFHNPLARAQKRSEIDALNFSLADLAVLIDLEMKVMGYSEAMDWVNRDKAAKLIFDVRGAPAKIVNNDKEVAKIRQARAQAQAAQTQQQETIAATEAIKNVTPALAAMQQNQAA